MIMSKFRTSKQKELPEISTASLPDIVFMLLFFFMVATVMRSETLLVQNELPEASQVEKLDRKDVLMNIYVGKPSSRYKTSSNQSLVQLNDKLANVEEIHRFVASERALKNENVRPFLITALKIDKGTEMGLIQDIKKKLQEVKAFRVNYTTKDKSN